MTLAARASRRATPTVDIGGVLVGSEHPVVVQSMTNTDTADADATALQVAALAHAGSELVRVTVNNDAAVIGLQRTAETSTLILRAVGNIFVGLFSGSGEGLDDVAGPVGMVGVIGDVRTGLPPIFLLWFIGLISANLAVINLLPIPPLDGSRMVMAVVQRLTGNRISPATERLVYFTGWVALMLFLVVVTVGDVQNLLK